MTKGELSLFEYIKNRECLCFCCKALQKKIIDDNSLDILGIPYKGMICGVVKDMLLQYKSLKKEEEENG